MHSDSDLHRFQNLELSPETLTDFLWILVAVTNNPSQFSHAQACGGVVAAVAVARPVEAVPGAASSGVELAAAAEMLQKKNLLPILLLLWKMLPLQSQAAIHTFSAARPLASSSASHCLGAFFPSSERC
jgi:hypothetical protein